MVEAWLGEDVFRQRREDLRRAPRRGQRHGSRLHHGLVGGRRRRRREVLLDLPRPDRRPGGLGGAPLRRRAAARSCPSGPTGRSARPRSRRPGGCRCARGLPGATVPACTVLPPRRARSGSTAARARTGSPRTPAPPATTGRVTSAAEARHVLETERLTTAERVALTGDVDALIATGDVAAADALAARARCWPATPTGSVVSASVEPGAGPGGARAGSAARRASLRSCATSYGERARSLGWAMRPGESEETRAAAPALVLRAIVGEPGRDPELGARGRSALVGALADGPERPRPRARDDRARGGDRVGRTGAGRAAQQERRAHDGRERRERLLAGLAACASRARARAARARRSTSASTHAQSIGAAVRLGRQRETRRAAFDFLKANYDALVARQPQGEFSPVRLLPVGRAGLCAEDTHAGDRRLLRNARSGPDRGAPRAHAGARERRPVRDAQARAAGRRSPPTSSRCGTSRSTGGRGSPRRSARSACGRPPTGCGRRHRIPAAGCAPDAPAAGWSTRRRRR